jgi:alkanesulfonate monooxygenase SsuD/methylene tetrahydromethanopterin reductase-like flavin-dependent oxidoreductase (luciferase family)
MTTTGDAPVRIGFAGAGDARHLSSLEARGVDSLWVGGHVASPNASPEAMMGLARLAALTERVTIGTSILLLPLYPPAIVAKQIADLDRGTGGRVVLGIGVGGEYPPEFRACEIPVRERGPRTDEMIPLIRRLWSAETITHEGRFYAMEDVRVLPAPLQPGGPPIVVAGRQEPAMRRAALLGDGWFPYLYSPRRYAASVATVQQFATDASRDLLSFEWYLFLFVNVAADGDAARELAARSMGATYDLDFRAMVDRVAAAGTVADVTRRVIEFYDAGARHFVFCPATAGADPAPVEDRLLDEVVPALREHAARVSPR